MKKIVNGALLAFIFGVWTFQVDAKLEKKFAPLNINNQSNQQNEDDDLQNENNDQQNIINVQRQHFMNDVSNRLSSRWNPIQRAQISNITFLDTDDGSVEISPVMSQGANFQSNFTNWVAAIVDRLQELVEGREIDLVRVATQSSQNGIVFTPIFLQDPFDSDGDEEISEEESEEPSNGTTNTVQNTSVNQNPPVNQQNLGNQTAFDSESEENINFEEEGDGQNNPNTSFVPER